MKRKLVCCVPGCRNGVAIKKRMLCRSHYNKWRYEMKRGSSDTPQAAKDWRPLIRRTVISRDIQRASPEKLIRLLRSKPYKPIMVNMRCPEMVDSNVSLVMCKE